MTLFTDIDSFQATQYHYVSWVYLNNGQINVVEEEKKDKSQKRLKIKLIQ
jgi:hypothetical protein